MIPRSKVRQHALQLLYSIQEQQTAPDTFDFDAFWEISTEKDAARLVTAEAKAITHLCRNADDLDRLQNERAETALNLMDSYIETASLRENLEKLLRSCNNFTAALRQLRFTYLHRERRGIAELRDAVADAFRNGAITAALAEGLLPVFADYPAFRSVLQPLDAVLRRRLKLLDNLAELSHPLDQPLGSEYAGLVQEAEALRDLRPEVERLVHGVLEHREEIEAKLAATVQNYEPARLDTVDACILQLGLYELLYAGLPVAIVVAEMTALANAFSGVKSARFIHGIVGAAAEKR